MISLAESFYNLCAVISFSYLLFLQVCKSHFSRRLLGQLRVILPATNRVSYENSETEARSVVFVDPVDTDNLLLCLEAIKGALKINPSAVTPIVLSPRVVDFKAKPYGAHFKKLAKAVGIEKLMTPLTKRPGWVDDLDSEVRVYFGRDADFSERYIRNDVHLYMRLTAFRFASFFEKQRLPRRSYAFYWDPESVNKIQVGMRHAIHVADYSYDFNEDQLCKYNTACLAEDGNDRRDQLLIVCEDYVAYQAKRFEYSDPEAILHDFSELVELKRQTAYSSTLLIGGPFTEAQLFLEQLPVSSACAMAFYIHGNTNLFKNQYNVLLDMDSTIKFLECVQKRVIPFTIVPTECIKASPFELDPEELEEVFKPAPWIYTMVKKFTLETNTLKKVAMYDWVAALVQKNPSLLPVKRVKWRMVKVDGDDVIRFHESPEGFIWMCWNDYEHMEKRKSDLIRLMQETVTSY